MKDNKIISNKIDVCETDRSERCRPDHYQPFGEKRLTFSGRIQHRNPQRFGTINYCNENQSERQRDQVQVTFLIETKYVSINVGIHDHYRKEVVNLQYIYIYVCKLTTVRNTVNSLG